MPRWGWIWTKGCPAARLTGTRRASRRRRSTGSGVWAMGPTPSTNTSRWTVRSTAVRASGGTHPPSARRALRSGGARAGAGCMGEGVPAARPLGGRALTARSQSSTPRIAILGAGPVGLDAALAALDAAYEVDVYEVAGRPAANVRAWGHVRLFSPWAMNVSPRMRSWADRSGLSVPADSTTCPTGAEYPAVPRGSPLGAGFPAGPPPPRDGG